MVQQANMQRDVLVTNLEQQLEEVAQGLFGRKLEGLDDKEIYVALLELTSYLATVQNREIDRLREEHYAAYLKLLGEAPQTLTPARLMAVPEGDGAIWPGMRFDIDGVPFEVEEAPGDGWRRVQKISLLQGRRRSALREDAPLIVGHDAPAELEMTLTAPLAAGAPAPLWLELQPEPGRVPNTR